MGYEIKKRLGADSRGKRLAAARAWPKGSRAALT